MLENGPEIVWFPADLESAADRDPELLTGKNGHAKILEWRTGKPRHSRVEGSILDVIVFARRFSEETNRCYIEIIEENKSQRIDFPGPSEVQIPGFACVRVCLFE